MQTLILVSFSIFLVSYVWASHPEVKKVNFSGVEYSCHPVNTPQYCPRRSFDVPMNVMISLERQSCLDLIEKLSPNLKDEIKKCFLNPRLMQFHEDLQLYDVKISCLKENLKTCIEYDLACNDPPCGDLGNFIKELRKRGLQQFDQADGEAACNLLIQ